MSVLFLTVYSQLLLLNNSICGEILFGGENTAEITNKKYLQTSNNFWNHANNIIPSFIVLPTCEKGISQTLSIIRLNSIPFRVRSGGHHYLSYSKCNGLCIVIDLRNLKKIEIQLDSDDIKLPPILTVGVGIKVFEIVKKFDEFNSNDKTRAVFMPVGNCDTVAVGGFIQSGGQTQLGQETGFAADYLISARIIIANGDVIEVSESQHKDLFFALRGGGGGNFGIVTEYKMRTVENLPNKKIFKMELTYKYSLENLLAVGLTYTRLLSENNYGNHLSMHLTILGAPHNMFIQLHLRISGNFDDFDDLYADTVSTIKSTPIRSSNKTLSWVNAFRDGMTVFDLNDLTTIVTSRLVFKPLLSDFWQTIHERFVYILSISSPSLIVTPWVDILALGGAYESNDMNNIKTSVPYRDAISNIHLSILSPKYTPSDDFEILLDNLKLFDQKVVDIIKSEAVYMGTPSVNLNDDNYEMAVYGSKHLYKKLQKIKCKYDPNGIFKFELGIKTNCEIQSKSKSKSKSKAKRKILNWKSSSAKLKNRYKKRAKRAKRGKWPKREKHSSKVSKDKKSPKYTEEWKNHPLDGFIKFEDVSSVLKGAKASGGKEDFPGVAVFDCNNDNKTDILYARDIGERVLLFLNNNNNMDMDSFTEVGLSRGLTNQNGALSVLAVDIDNDGWIDLVFSSQWYFIEIYRNKGNCYFEDITSDILSFSEILLNIPLTGGMLAAGDYDNDGDLDILISSTARIYSPPAFEPVYITSSVRLLINKINDKTSGKFVPRSQAPILPHMVFVACQVSFEDFNEDGMEDIIISLCPGVSKQETLLWLNVKLSNGMHGFKDVSNLYGLGLYGSLGSSMCHTFGDFDGDNHFDLLMSDMGQTFGGTSTNVNVGTRLLKSVWVENKLKRYVDIAPMIGIDLNETAWSSLLIDVDNDGWDDIVIQGNYASLRRLNNPGFVYRNVYSDVDVSSKFINYRSAELKQTLGLKGSNTVGLGFGDFNRDGFIDFAVSGHCKNLLWFIKPASNCVVPSGDELMKLFKNSGVSDVKRNYLDIELRGFFGRTNFYGIGSKIEVFVDKIDYYKVGKIRCGTGWGGTDEFYAHFGIPNYKLFSKLKARVVVTWMGSSYVDTYHNLSLNQRIILREKKHN